MKKKVSLIILALIVVIAAFVCYYNGSFYSIYNILSYDEVNICDVSCITLIAEPKKFNGKYIRIEGVLEVGFESNGIYLTQNDYEHMVTKNALWLDIDDEMYSQKGNELEKMNGEYVIVEGVFNGNEKGHLGMYSGTIERVTRIDRCKTREEFAEILNNYNSSGNN